MLKTAVAVLFLCFFAVFSIALKTEVRRDKSPVAALKIGEPMADFELPDPTGKTVKLSEVSRDKKIVMLNFWATWCGPCRKCAKAHNRSGFFHAVWNFDLFIGHSESSP